MPPLHQGAEVRGEPDPALAVLLEGHNVAGVQGGGAGPGIDFRAQADHAEVRQGDPLTESDHGEMVESLHYRLSGKVGAF
ncbi:hypothetical protein D3C72_2015490 [compost metagenome]